MKIIWCFLLIAGLMGCDGHIEIPDNSLAVGQILCTDGRILPFDSVQATGRKPIAVVFYVNHDESVEGNGYAVYLKDLEPSSFADSLGVEQGTSADMSALDGNRNTYAMQACEEVSSPLALQVADIWIYNQSAYIPSVRQMQLMSREQCRINPVLKACGGDTLSLQADACWYWTSTEVKEQEKNRAWLYSVAGGFCHGTNKTVSHKGRAVVTIIQDNNE